MAGDQFFGFAPQPQAAKKRAKPLQKTGRSAIARHGRLWPDRPPWHAKGAGLPWMRRITHDDSIAPAPIAPPPRLCMRAVGCGTSLATDPALSIARLRHQQQCHRTGLS